MENNKTRFFSQYLGAVVFDEYYKGYLSNVHIGGSISCICPPHPSPDGEWDEFELNASEAKLELRSIEQLNEDDYRAMFPGIEPEKITMQSLIH